MPRAAWAEEVGSCVTDVIATRPDDPLKLLAHLLSRQRARPNWNETASAYAKRHNLEQRLGVAVDAAGLSLRDDAPPEAIDRLCRELLTLAGQQVPASPQQHRIVSYNLLSPELAEPNRFTRCAAADLDTATRLGRIRARLAEHMAASAVLCLQEVSAKWAVKLAPLFEEHRYTVVSAMYNSKVFTGYMGNLLCWPVRRANPSSLPCSSARGGCVDACAHVARCAWQAGRYVCLDADSLRVKDTKKKWPPPPPPPASASEAGAPGARPPFDPWEAAQNAENAIVMARLRPRAKGGAEFCVGSWHGPVAFGAPPKIQMAVLLNGLAGALPWMTNPGPLHRRDARPCSARAQRALFWTSRAARRACWPATSTRGLVRPRRPTRRTRSSRRASYQPTALASRQRARGRGASSCPRISCLRTRRRRVPSPS